MSAPAVPRPSVLGRALALALGVCAGLLLAACRPAEDPLAPPTIVYGEDVCDECTMTISDVRYAAATLVEVDGHIEPRRFDDIGDMLAYAKEHPEHPVRRWWVHDFESGEWVDGETATFVRSAALRTPMGHGLAAYADAGRATAAAQAMGGAAVTLADLLQAVEEMNPEPGRK